MFIIVDPKLLNCTILNAFNATKQVMIQPVIPCSSVVAHHVRVPLRITRFQYLAL